MTIVCAGTPLKEGVTIATEQFVSTKVDLTLLGGKVFSLSQVTAAIPVFQMIQSVYLDWVIGGVSDLHPQKA